VRITAAANDVAAWAEGNESPRTPMKSGGGCGSVTNGLGRSTGTLIASAVRSAVQTVTAVSSATNGRRVASASPTAMRIQIAPP
jgi:hypothetical protein